MRMSAPLLVPVVVHRVSTHWAVTSVPVLLDSPSSSSPAVARMWTSAPPLKPPAAMVAPTPKEDTSVAVLRDTTGLAKGKDGMWNTKGIWAWDDITRIVRYTIYGMLKC